MKNFIKILVITLAVAGIIIMLTSCEKEMNTSDTEYKGDTYFRVESVSKSGETDYSTIQRIEIK